MRLFRDPSTQSPIYSLITHILQAHMYIHVQYHLMPFFSTSHMILQIEIMTRR
ncbi:hypothetical protein CY34DRAFT_801188 [Suillus luteus UH-Slu-Lm8-n1]|uniref:Uncharacterized protein n=1 Tax=Suillus luteus UH-Slu-Lm8-n1 TaxID=930992 RepID=A0A0D0BRR3_9AGAM|nr:hypothetical protein CY34DRAFT_801188 [Suillus luteus UH-Slu-Lm8-n1]